MKLGSSPKLASLIQALGQVAALRQQQALLKTDVQGEVALASSECTHQLESAQYKLRQKAMLMQGEAQGESLTIGKLQAYIGQVWVPEKPSDGDEDCQLLLDKY